MTSSVNLASNVCKHGQLARSCELCEKDEEIIRLHAEIDRLVIRVVGENARLRSAIRLTIEQNGHLADGENCTLSHLKKAIGDG